MKPTEIRAIRDRMRLTQADLADRLGTTQACISRWESGCRSPRGPAVVLLRSLAGLSKKKK